MPHTYQEKYVKPDEFKALLGDFGTKKSVWQHVVGLVQAAASFSFAARAPSHTPEEIDALHENAKDLVRNICAHQ